MEVVKVGFAGRTGRTQIRHRKKFAFRERFRYDKRAEVSICKLRKSDTCVFALTPRNFFPVPDSIFSRSAMLSSLSARYPGATLIYLYQYTFVSVTARNRWESFKHCSNVAEKFCVKWVLSTSVWGTGSYSAHTVTHLTSGSDPRNANFSATLRTLKKSHRFPAPPW